MSKVCNNSRFKNSIQLENFHPRQLSIFEFHLDHSDAQYTAILWSVIMHTKCGARGALELFFHRHS